MSVESVESAESADGTAYRPRQQAAAGQGTLVEERPVARVLGQFEESYIVAVDEEGLVLIDQHAAHERVLFEKYLEDAIADEVEVQALMFPETAELSPDEHALLTGELDEFRRLGFQIEPFGGTAVRNSAAEARAASDLV